MSDYTKTTNFTAKDALSSGDPLKLIKGSYFDTEFDNIATAIATKYDSGNIASQAEAEAESSNTVLMTPGRLAQWADYNAGIVGDIQALTAPGADRILFWDHSSTAGAFLTVGDGLTITATTIALAASVAGAGLTHSSGVLAVGAGNGITVNANDVALSDQSATTSIPIAVASGAFDFAIDALTNIEGSALAGTDEFIVDDNGTPKAVAVQAMGFRIQTSQTTQNLAATDMNSIMKFTGTATLTIQTNATEDIPLGVPVVLIMDHATQELTVTADTGVTLESVFHPGGTSAASDTVLAGGMAVLVQTETDVWQISGDIAT